MNNSFGAWLARQLVRREMTQSDLATKLGTRPSTVGNWIHGRRVPGVESCWSIADALDLTPATVMRMAGHPVEIEEGSDDLEDRLVAMWRKLSPDGKTTTIEFVEFLRGRERRNA